MGTKKVVDKVNALLVGRNALEREVYKLYSAPIVGLAEVVMPKNQKAYCVASVLGAAGLDADVFVKHVNLLGVVSKQGGGFLSQVVKVVKGKTVAMKAKPYCEAVHCHALRADRAMRDKERKYIAPTIAHMRGEFGVALCTAIASLCDIKVSAKELEAHLAKWEKANS